MRGTAGRKFDGGGIRRGFGELSALPDRNDKAEDESSPPSITAEDLRPEVLESEKNRAKDILKSLSINSVKIETPAGIVVAPSVNPTSILSTKSSISEQSANINELKDIFYREGGVEWDDDVKKVDKSNSKSVKFKNQTTDEVFLKAEESGIDVRTKQHDDNNGSDGFNFSFFDAPMISSNQEDDDVGHTSSSNKIKQNNQPKSEITSRKQENIISVQKVKHIPSDSECIALAKKMTRKKSLEDIKSTWLSNKEKCVLGYKKKRRDALRARKKQQVKFAN